MKRKITPHKGGRSVRLIVRIRPETKALLERIAKGHDKSLGDLIEEWTLEAAEKLEQAPSE